MSNIVTPCSYRDTGSLHLTTDHTLRHLMFYFWLFGKAFFPQDNMTIKNAIIRLECEVLKCYDNW